MSHESLPARGKRTRHPSPQPPNSEDRQHHSNRDSGNYPSSALLPKDPIQASAFLKQYPDYDGRNVIVGIFDTGVDPGAAGLDKTPDGKPKVIGLVDCSASGDVDTHTVVQAISEGTIVGATGRTLQLNNSWSNPSGKYRIGCKRAFDLLPPPLVKRLKEERKKKFTEQQTALVGALTQQKQAASGDEVDKIDLLISQADTLMAAYDDLGPLYDVVAFNDGKVWRVCVDTECNGDLKQSAALTDYHLEYQYATIKYPNLMNYGVNIYNNGDLVSIVCTGGSHGTHVASIVGGYHPNNPELNGIAPGCQFVSIRIGDNRLDDQETATTMTRAAIAAQQFKVDLVNMSFGEPYRNNVGRTWEVFSKEMVNHPHHRITFCKSSGNSGPNSFTSQGLPDGITVGAYLDSNMAVGMEAMNDMAVSEACYGFTSADPTCDGQLVNSISAPGAAYASVPNYQRNKSATMRGTSMASPNCCGGLALMISGLKQLAVPYSPLTLRMSIINTADKKVCENGADIYRTGAGLMQVQAAFQHQQGLQECALQHCNFKVDFYRRSHSTGVLISTYAEASYPSTHLASIRTVWPENIDSQLKLDFECRLQLKCDQNWVTFPQFICLSSDTRYISIDVDPTFLPEGELSTSQIFVYDSKHMSAGPLFHIPVNVLKPIYCVSYTVPPIEITATPGLPVKRFIEPPRAATSCKCTVTGHDITSNRELRLCTLQPLLNRRTNTIHDQKIFTLSPQEVQYCEYQSVQPDAPLELCVLQSFKSRDNTHLTLSIEFSGIRADSSAPNTSMSSGSITMCSGLGVCQIDTVPTLRNQVMDVTATLTKLQRFIKPSTHTVTSLHNFDNERLINSYPSENHSTFNRDYLSYSKQGIYSAVIDYTFSLTEKCDVDLKFGNDLSDVIYDSPVDGCDIHCYNASNRLLFISDAVKSYTTKLDKGEYKVQVQVRHETQSVLNKLVKVPLVVQQKLEKEVKLSAYPTLQAAQTGGGSISTLTISAGRSVSVYLASSAEFPKDGNSGDQLIGNFSLRKSKQEREATKETRSITYVLQHKPDPNKKSVNGFATVDTGTDNKKDNDNTDNKDMVGKLQSQIAKDLVSYIKSQITKATKDAPLDKYGFRKLAAPSKDIEQLIEHCIPQYSTNLQVRLACLDYFNQTGNQEQIVSTCDAIMDIVKVDAINFRTPSDEKEAAIEALYSKALSLSYSLFCETLDNEESQKNDTFNTKLQATTLLYKDLNNLVDVGESRNHSQLQVLMLVLQGKLGGALKALLSDASLNFLREEQLSWATHVVSRLGWSHWAALLVENRLSWFPKTCEPK